MTPDEKRYLIVFGLVAVILLFIGWKLFWFICDDAYISFRYISNSMEGHGYVWNPPPSGQWRVTQIFFGCFCWM